MIKMDIMQQLRRVHLHKVEEIIVDSGILPNIDMACLAAIMHQIIYNDGRLILSPQILTYFRKGVQHTFPITVNISHDIDPTIDIPILSMLYVISIFSSNIKCEIRHNYKRVKCYDRTLLDYLEEFGVKDTVLAKRVIQTMGLDRPYDEDADNNVSRYLGIITSSKSARNV